MVAGAAADDLPTHSIARGDLEAGIRVYVALAESGLVKSRGEGRRMIKGGGVRIGTDKVDDAEADLTLDHLSDDGVVLRVGKKRAVRIIAA